MVSNDARIIALVFLVHAVQLEPLLHHLRVTQKYLLCSKIFDVIAILNTITSLIALYCEREALSSMCI